MDPNTYLHEIYALRPDLIGIPFSVYLASYTKYELIDWSTSPNLSFGAGTNTIVAGSMAITACCSSVNFAQFNTWMSNGLTPHGSIIAENAIIRSPKTGTSLYFYETIFNWATLKLDVIGAPSNYTGIKFHGYGFVFDKTISTYSGYSSGGHEEFDLFKFPT